MNNLLQIVEFLAEYTHDPLGFVYAAFPWGEKDTPLAKIKGPEEWQKRLLTDIRDRIKTPNEVIREAIASGHGIGKSAMVAWLVLWAMSTHEDTRGVVTANTATQLATKTWPELIKWHQLFVGKDLFAITATSIFSVDKEHEKTWRIDAIPWSETNTEAFAGLHNQGKRLLLIFDEASAIANPIWEVAEGAMTDDNTEIIWCVFGNPTRNSGRFYDCFHKFRDLWTTEQIDSRTVGFSNKKRIQEWIDTWGMDSDFVKIRVLGQFPSASETQLISSGLAIQAHGKRLMPHQYDFAPPIIGVDPAWMGGDAFAIVLRQGLMADVLAVIPKNDNDLLMANTVARFEDQYKAKAVNIDLGYGTGVYSAGISMGRSWHLIPFAGKSPDRACANMRAYMWDKMRLWLIEGGAFPKGKHSQQLLDDMTGVEIKPRDDGLLQLQSKEYMKSKGIPSPNVADALALTFAINVSPVTTGKRALANTNYQMFND